MAFSGLTEAEQGRLHAAGFHPRFVEVVADEAATMRLLWLRRLRGSGLAAGVAVVAGVAAGAVQVLDGALFWIATVLVSFLGALIGLAPWLEVRLLRQHEPVRWAARRLALLAVSATDEDENDDASAEAETAAAEESLDDESSNSDDFWTRLQKELTDEEDDAASNLQVYAERAARFDNPYSALRHLAREMMRKATGTDPRNPAPNRTMTVDQAQLSDTVWRAVAMIAVLTIIALLAARVMLQ